MIDLIIPVPLHPSRLRAREFNQSLLLADRIGLHLARPIAATCLVRILATAPQTMLNRQERLAIFAMPSPFASLRPLQIDAFSCVDDVYTTGTTLNECAKTLRKAGSGPVYALTLARTVDANLVPDRVFVEQAAQPLSELGM